MEKIMREIDKIRNEEDLRTLNSYIIRKLRVMIRSGNVKASLKFYTGMPVEMKPECIKNKADRLYGLKGKIIKMGQSKAKCNFGKEGGNWTIPFSMLRIAK